MSLLSGLLDRIEPLPATVETGTLKGTGRNAPARALTVVSNMERLPTIPDRANAYTASPAWRCARDQYVNHLMTCRSCYAPTARHCTTGADLRITYDRTSMGVTR